MIIKKRVKPAILDSYEAILARLRNDFTGKEKVEQDFSKHHRDFLGLISIDYNLNNLGSSYAVLHDVNIKVENQYLEIDILIITPKSIYIIDVNNDIGEFPFEFPTGQIQSNSDKPKLNVEKLYPLLQLEIQKVKLQKWLKTQGYGHSVMEGFVVVSDPQVMIKVMRDFGTGPSPYPILMSSKLQQALIDKEERKGKSFLFQSIDHEELGKRIKESCEKRTFDLSKNYNITDEDITTGVACPACNTIGMKFRKRSKEWECKACGAVDDRAHKQALLDYFHIFKKALTTLEAAKWLQIESMDIVYRLLKKEKYTFVERGEMWYWREQGV